MGAGGKSLSRLELVENVYSHCLGKCQKRPEAQNSAPMIIPYHLLSELGLTEDDRPTLNGTSPCNDLDYTSIEMFSGNEQNCFETWSMVSKYMWRHYTREVLRHLQYWHRCRSRWRHPAKQGSLTYGPSALPHLETH